MRTKKGPANEQKRPSHDPVPLPPAYDTPGRKNDIRPLKRAEGALTRWRPWRARMVHRRPDAATARGQRRRPPKGRHRARAAHPTTNAKRTTNRTRPRRGEKAHRRARHGRKRHKLSFPLLGYGQPPAQGERNSLRRCPH